MNIDLVSQAVALTQTKTRVSAQFLMLKKQNEMQRAVLEMVDTVSAKAPPPPGQGSKIDKHA